MKKILFAIMSCLCLTTPSATAENKYRIVGTAEGMDGDVACLMHNRDTIAVDTIKNGAFCFEDKTDTVFMAIIAIEQKVAMQLFLEKGTIHVNANERNVNGTYYNDELNWYFGELQRLTHLLRDDTVERDSVNQAYINLDKEYTKKHNGDPIGLMLFQRMANGYDSAALDSIMNCYPLYRNDPELNFVLRNKKASESSAVGKTYTDFKGIDVETDKPISLSDYLAKGKIVLVDFWASWCGPCRQEIKEHLAHYYEDYKDKVTFVSVAVWENSIKDTRRALSSLPIKWNVMFAGGRENSPTEKYGIMGIPEIMLISPDGTILAKSLRGDAIIRAINENLK